MKTLVQRFRGDPHIRDIAFQITSGIAKDPRTGLANRRNADNIANAIYNWTNTHIAYTWDPVDIEWLQSPDITLKKGYGDCDDHSILAASLLESLGIPTRFIIVKVNPRYPTKYTHIYVEYQSKGKWKPYDTTLHSQAGLGVPPNRIFGKKAISLDGIPVKKKLKRTIMPDLVTAYTFDRNNLGSDLGDLGLGQVPVDPQTLISAGKKVYGFASDALNFAECTFAPKTCRNRKRREWRDKAMKWLYSQGVKQIGDTGRDGRYNDSIQKLMGLVKTDSTNAVPIINRYIGNAITPASVDNVIQQYNNLVHSLHPGGTGSGTNSGTSNGGTTTNNGSKPALMTTSQAKGSNMLMPILIGSGVLLVGGGIFYVAMNRSN